MPNKFWIWLPIWSLICSLVIIVWKPWETNKVTGTLILDQPPVITNTATWLFEPEGIGPWDDEADSGDMVEYIFSLPVDIDGDGEVDEYVYDHGQSITYGKALYNDLYLKSTLIIEGEKLSFEEKFKDFPLVQKIADLDNVYWLTHMYTKEN